MLGLLPQDPQKGPSLGGAVYPDDRVVALLDVSMAPGPLKATIALFSAKQYADAFDVLAGATALKEGPALAGQFLLGSGLRSATTEPARPADDLSAK